MLCHIAIAPSNKPRVCKKNALGIYLNKYCKGFTNYFAITNLNLQQFAMQKFLPVLWELKRRHVPLVTPYRIGLENNRTNNRTMDPGRENNRAA